MIQKSFVKTRECQVTFQIPRSWGARQAAVLGDFNDWNPRAHPLRPQDDGTLHVTIALPPGKDYRFRYLLDEKRWENDAEGDGLVPNRFGGEDTLLRLSAAPPSVEQDARTPLVEATERAGGEVVAVAASGPKPRVRKAAAPAKRAASTRPARASKAEPAPAVAEPRPRTRRRKAPGGTA